MCALCSLLDAFCVDRLFCPWIWYAHDSPFSIVEGYFVPCVQQCISVAKLQLVHIIDEVGKTHERGALVLRDERADTTRVAPGTSVKEAAELIVSNLVRVTAALAQVVLHVNGQLELGLDNLNENLLRHEALFVGLTAEGDECVKVLVRLIFLLVLQLEVLEESQRHQNRLHIYYCLVLLVKENVDLL